MTKVVGIPGKEKTGRNQKVGRKPRQLPKTRGNQWSADSPQYENNRDDRLDALLTNATASGKLHIDFDPFICHDSAELLHWFSDHKLSKGNRNEFIRYRRQYVGK